MPNSENFLSENSFWLARKPLISVSSQTVSVNLAKISNDENTVVHIDHTYTYTRTVMYTTICAQILLVGSANFNPLKCSGIRWIHLKVFNAIHV